MTLSQISLAFKNVKKVDQPYLHILSQEIIKKSLDILKSISKNADICEVIFLITLL